MSQVPSVKLTVPPGWEASTTIELLEPVRRELTAPLAFGAEVTGAPRANLTIHRKPSEHRSAAAALQSLIGDLSRYIPGLAPEEEGAFTFDDGVEGRAVTLVYPTPGGTRVAQRHVFRKDGELMTHFTASVEERQRIRLESDMDPIVRACAVA